VIDSWSDGVVTSIKSIDLNALTYQGALRLTYRLNAYIDNLALYDGSSMGTWEIPSSAIDGRVLNVVVPKITMTTVQQDAITAAIARAKALGVDLVITPF
jgi:filamentous hemagglutinin